MRFAPSSCSTCEEMKIGFIIITLSLFTGAFANLCEDNLGDSFGSSIDLTSWPTVQASGLNGMGMIQGRDDGISVFISGNYECVGGSAIEGEIVVLGDFTVRENSGLISVVSVGSGTQIVPNNDGDVMVVGGDVFVEETVTFFEKGADGNLVVGGTVQGAGNFVFEDGNKVIENASIPDYNDIINDIHDKSAYWATLPANGAAVHDGKNLLLLSAGEGDEAVQVFSIDGDLLDHRKVVATKFHASLKDKTVLINVHSVDGKVTMSNMAYFIDPTGSGLGTNFGTEYASSILWNLYDATDVDIGGDTEDKRGGVFVGSIIVPTPESHVRLAVPGHSGRFFVNGDVTQDLAGSIFYNFPFEPMSELSLPESCSISA